MDFETTRKPLADLPLPGYRGWKGTLNDKISMEKLLESKVVLYVSFDTEQQAFIKKFTTVLNTPASKKSIEKFNKFQEKKSFKTFDELIDTINIHNKDYPNVYIDVPLELLKKHAHKPSEFEDVFLKVYNTLSNFFGKDYRYKIARTIGVEKDLSATTGRRGAARNGSKGKLIQIEADGRILSYDENSLLNEWKAGGKVTSKNYKSFVHEFGHAVDYIHRIKFSFYKEIDSMSGLDSKTSINFVTTNKYKTEYCNNLDKIHKSCPYKISPKFDKSKFPDSLTSYSTTTVPNENTQPNPKRSHIAELLETFILDKVKNLKILGNNQAEKDKFTKTMLVKIFINSIYGRSKESDGEVPSEGFEYWLLADERFWNKAWEIWNEFYLEYLSAWRNNSIYFKK